MKKIINILLATLLITGVSTTSAHADENQATYAVVNSAGVVTNIIVCGPAVCGPNGSWGGTMPSDTPWAGQKLVLQVPVNSITGQSLGGYIGTSENPVKYDSQAQVFTQGSTSTPEPITRSETIDNVTLFATIQSEVKTFGPNSVVNNQMQFTPVITPTTGATISASQTSGETRTVTKVITNSKGETNTVTVAEFITTGQSTTFTTPKTKLQIEQSIQGRLTLIQRYLNRFYELLKGWVID
jgi:hypothetical protein